MRRRGRGRARAARQLARRLRRRPRAWTSTCSRRRVSPTLTQWWSRPTATTRTSSSDRSSQRRYGIGVRRRARARPAPGRVLRAARVAHRLPDADARSRSSPKPSARVSRRGRDPRRTDVPDRRRRRQGRIQRHPVAAAMGHEVTLVEQRRDRFEPLEAEFGPVALARRRHRDAHARARRHRAPARHRARRHGGRRGQPRDRADRQGGLRRTQGDRAGQRSSQPAALRPARHHPDGVRDLGAPRAGRARGAGARHRAPARAAPGGPRGRRDADPGRFAGRRQAGRRALRCRTGRVSSPSRGTASARSPSARP